MGVDDVACDDFVSSNAAIVGSVIKLTHQKIFRRQLSLICFTPEVLGIHSLAIQGDVHHDPRTCTLAQCQTMALGQRLSVRLQRRPCDDLFPMEFHRTCRSRTLPKYDFHDGVDLCRLRLGASRRQSFHPTPGRSMIHHSSRLAALEMRKREQKIDYSNIVTIKSCRTNKA